MDVMAGWEIVVILGGLVMVAGAAVGYWAFREGAFGNFGGGGGY